jgi:hypothetical protein
LRVGEGEVSERLPAVEEKKSSGAPLMAVGVSEWDLFWFWTLVSGTCSGSFDLGLAPAAATQ